MKSFGTEGRELLDTTGQTNFVAPQDTVHAYLLFRGQDIKDLHVHEKQGDTTAADTAPAEEGEEAAPAAETKKETSAKAKTESKENKTNTKKGGNQKKSMVGSGASLLNKKARGAKGDQSE